MRVEEDGKVPGDEKASGLGYRCQLSLLPKGVKDSKEEAQKLRWDREIERRGWFATGFCPLSRADEG